MKSFFDLTIKDALLSEDRLYRYTLIRRWNKVGQVAVFIGMNPSTADETEDDMTIKKCMGFALRWGCGGICMLNLFAYRTTYPSELARVLDPIGKDNDEILKQYTSGRELVVACWGDDGQYLGRDRQVIDLLKFQTTMLCLGKTNSGNPRHPSRISYDTRLEGPV